MTPFEFLLMAFEGSGFVWVHNMEVPVIGRPACTPGDHSFLCLQADCKTDKILY